MSLIFCQIFWDESCYRKPYDIWYRHECAFDFKGITELVRLFYETLYEHHVIRQKPHLRTFQFPTV